MPPPLPKRSLSFANQLGTTYSSFCRCVFCIRLEKLGQRIDGIYLIREAANTPANAPGETLVRRHVCECAPRPLIAAQQTKGFERERLYPQLHIGHRETPVTQAGEKPSQLHCASLL